MFIMGTLQGLQALWKNTSQDIGWSLVDDVPIKGEANGAVSTIAKEPRQQIMTQFPLE